jgi:tetratricopeptide (TPR) repeat protein
MIRRLTWCLVLLPVLSAPEFTFAEQSDVEPVQLEAVSTSGLIDSRVFLDYGTITADRYFASRSIFRPEDMLWKNATPIKADVFQGEPQFAMFLDWTSEELARYVEVFTDDVEALTVLAVRLYQAREIEQSIAMFERARQISGLHLRSSELYSGVLIHANDLKRAIRLIHKLSDELPDNHVIRFNLACAYALNDNAAGSMYHLGVAAQMGWPEMGYFMDDKDLDLLRKTDAFIELQDTLIQQSRNNLNKKLLSSTFRSDL